MRLRRLMREAEQKIQQRGGDSIEFTEEERELIDTLAQLLRLELYCVDDDEDSDSGEYEKELEKVNELIIQVSDELEASLIQRA